VAARDPYQYFRIEARELLEQMVQGVLEVERGAAPPDAIPRLLRLAHTLKGAARVVKRRTVADRAHAFEEVLEPHRDDPSSLSAGDQAVALGLLDEIAADLTAIDEAAPAAEPDGTPAPPVRDAGAGTARAEIADMDEALTGIVEAGVQLGALTADRVGLDRAAELVGLLVEQADAGPARSGPPGVGLGRALAEELQSLLVSVGRRLDEGTERVDRELRLARRAAERLRLVPADGGFTALERAARDVAQEHGKQVAFTGVGHGVRLAGNVLETIDAALLQLVRNAVAHGIEPVADRRRAGKPDEGRVSLEVTRRGNRVAFACHDDGRGIDLQAVRDVARARGLAAVDPDALDTDGVVELLLRGGISTAGTVSEVAGRGIGLDVVRDAAHRLGGTLRADTEPGRGTTIELEVPLSLTTVTTLVVDAGGTRASLPLHAVEGTIRIPSEEVLWSASGATIVHGDATIAFLPLSDLLARDRRPGARTAPWSGVVVRSTAGRIAVGVDRLVGTADAVVRPLPPLTPDAPLVSGVTADLDGGLQLVLDPEGLAVEARQGSVPQPTAIHRPEILVVDDSLTTRMLEHSILDAAGFQVGLASSAEEALDLLEVHTYDLVLVDVEMPGIDGFTFIERIRADARLAHLPAILVTSLSSPEHLERGRQVGANGYIAKGDFDQGRMLDEIRALLAG
jgi:two-component system chemotaxis sensor kinase CheA